MEVLQLLLKMDKESLIVIGKEKIICYKDVCHYITGRRIRIIEFQFSFLHYFFIQFFSMVYVYALTNLID